MPIRYDGPKVPIEEVKRFARIALNDPRIVEIVQKQIDTITPSMPDEEREALTMGAHQLIREHMDKQGIDWRLKHGYGAALYIVSRILKGQAKSVDDVNSYDGLRLNHTVLFGDESD